MKKKVVYAIILLTCLSLGILIGYFFASKKSVEVHVSSNLRDSIMLDEAPDNELVASLIALSNAQKIDTLISHLNFKVRGKDVSMADYVEFQGVASGLRNGMSRTGALYKFLSELSLSETKVLNLFERFRQQASFLTRQDFDFGAKIPKQNKIAYSWGSKQYTQSAIPSKYDRLDHCNDKIHGLDCSGFISQLFVNNNIFFPDSIACADNERRPEFLIKYLKPYFQGAPFQVRDLDHIPLDSLQTGDILYFRNNKTKKVAHIAIVLINGQGVVSLYQSLGSPNACVRNMDRDHGPVVKILKTGVGDDKRKYYCVRISAV